MHVDIEPEGDGSAMKWPNKRGGRKAKEL